MSRATKALPFGEESALFGVALQKRLPPTGGGRESEPDLPPLVLLLCAENEARGPSFLGGNMESLKLDAASTALILIDLLHGIAGRETAPYTASAVVEKGAALAKT